MRNCWTRTVVISTFMLVATCTAEAGRLAPELRERLASASGAERIPILIVLAPQADARQIRLETAGLEREARRSHARRSLRSLADVTQGEILRVIEEAATRQEAAPPVSLWLLNAIRTEATAAVVEQIQFLPGVDRILWDPRVPLEQQLDDGPQRGRASRARGSGAPRGDGQDSTIAWQASFVKAPEAWGLGYDGSGIVIGLVDTGVDYTHPDLADHIWVNDDEIPDNAIDDDLNGYVDDVMGWDFVGEDPDPMGMGPGDHGTRVAGIAAGDGTSGTVTGIAPGATIMPLRGSGGTWGDLIEALEYAVENDADVISMSISQKWRFNPKPDYAAWRTLMDNELAAGIVHANSIGNEGDNWNTDPIPFNIAAPGNCPAPWVPADQILVGGTSGAIGVGAVNAAGFVGDFSSRGPSAWEDIALKWGEYPYEMPAEYQDYPYSGGRFGLLKPDICGASPDCVTTEFGGGYSLLGGTSAATPQVAGAMAILLQARPDLTPEEVAIILISSADDLGPQGMDTAFGAGLLDVEAALQMALAWDTFSIFSGVVRDAVTLEPVPNASVSLYDEGYQSLNLRRTARSDGSFVFVQESGVYALQVDEFFHFADTVDVVVPPGFSQVADILLPPRDLTAVTGTVTDAETADSLAGVEIRLPDTGVDSQSTDTTGTYVIGGLPVGRQVTLQAVRFGHWPQSQDLTLSPDTSIVDFALAFGVKDDFELDQGWSVGEEGDAAWSGIWERADPVATYEGETMVQPESDATPDSAGTSAFITGNNLQGADPDWNDVDDGRTTLISPVFSATRWNNPMLQVRTWYSNDTGFVTDDVFTVRISSDGGMSWTVLETFATSHREWLLSQWNLSDWVTITDSMRISFVVEDAGGQSTVETGVDEVEILESLSSVGERLDRRGRSLALSAAPSPFQHRLSLSLVVPSAGRVRVEIINLEGRRVRTLWNGRMEPGHHVLLWDGSTDAGHPVSSGFYLARLSQGGEERHFKILRVR